MIVHSLICYLTVVEGLTWRTEDYTANKIIKAVKGEDFGAYFEVIIAKKPNFLPILFGAIGRKMGELLEWQFLNSPYTKLQGCRG